MTDVLIRRWGFGHTLKTRRGEVYMKMKAEIGFRLTKDCQQPSEARRKGRTFP